MEHEFAQANACPEPGKDKHTEQGIGENIEDIPSTCDCKKDQDDNEQDNMPRAHRLTPLSASNPRVWHWHSLQNLIKNGCRCNRAYTRSWRHDDTMRKSRLYEKLHIVRNNIGTSTHRRQALRRPAPHPSAPRTARPVNLLV